jgi:hypothetical protein
VAGPLAFIAQLTRTRWDVVLRILLFG